MSDEQTEPEPYCDYCEQDGHTFRSCPRRDDDVEADLEEPAHISTTLNAPGVIPARWL